MTSKAQMNSVSMQMGENIGARAMGCACTRARPCPALRRRRSCCRLDEGDAGLLEEHRGHEAAWQVRAGVHRGVRSACMTSATLPCACASVQLGESAGGVGDDARNGRGDGARTYCSARVRE
jgi:hypothetical protein